MDALDVISVEEAKSYLRIDFGDCDGSIAQMIGSAVDIVERYTNCLLYERGMIYAVTQCGSVDIYDYPVNINSVLLGGQSTQYTTRQFAQSIRVQAPFGSTVAATVGYNNTSQYPAPYALKQAALKMVAYLYENRDMYQAQLPTDVRLLVNPYRRSATI